MQMNKQTVRKVDQSQKFHHQVRRALIKLKK
jgi:hypothetical protein